MADGCEPLGNRGAAGAPPHEPRRFGPGGDPSQRRPALATGDPGRGRSDAEMWAAASSGGTTLSFPGALLLPALPLELSSKALMLPARGALRK